MKKLFAIFIVLSMVLTFTTACDSGTQQPSGGSGETAPASGGNVDAPKGSDAPIPAPDSGASGTFNGVINIGALASITGNPLNGLHMVRGIEMALAEVNARGGVLGKEVRLIFEDSSNQPDIGINAANRLASTDVVAIVGPHYSSVAMAVEAIMAQEQIPMLFGGTSPRLVQEVNNDWIFRVRASDLIQARAAANYLVTVIGATRVGIMHGSDEFGVGGMEVASQYFDEVGVEWVAEAHNVDDRDVTGQVSSMRAANIDAVLIWSVENPWIVVARQMFEQGLHVPVISNPTLFVQSAIDQFQPQWVEGFYGVSDFMTTNPDPVLQDFIARYEAKYDTLPDLHVAAYYGAALLIVDAIERAGSAERDAIRQALMETKNFQAIVGVLNANEHGEMVHEISIGRMENLEPYFLQVIQG